MQNLFCFFRVCQHRTILEPHSYWKRVHYSSSQIQTGGCWGTKRKCYSCAMPSPSCNRYGESLTKIFRLNSNAGHRILTHGQETMAWLSGFSQKHSISSSKEQLAFIKAAHQCKKLDEQDFWNESTWKTIRLIHLWIQTWASKISAWKKSPKTNFLISSRKNLY